ncbi:BQ2448_7001 [Microbotryum intermedium]|uniref:BQ2448_7001 protein n=1 Tax=Microbotryum intermedium TaxID=269621 RepID=A0A238FPQ7_9BASI|nr:BQ2448_7001 [Microbotryum intermedium]
MASIVSSAPFTTSAKSQPAPGLAERSLQADATSTYSNSQKDNTGDLVDEERNPMANFWVATCVIA